MSHLATTTGHTSGTMPGRSTEGTKGHKGSRPTLSAQNMIPHFFSKEPIGDITNPDLQKAIDEVKKASSKDAALRRAFQLVTQRFCGYRFRTYLFFWKAFEKNPKNFGNEKDSCIAPTKTSCSGRCSSEAGGSQKTKSDLDTASSGIFLLTNTSR